MFELLIALGLLAGSFAATNIDNLALLVGWLLAGRGRNRQILVGHLLGMLTILVLTVAFGMGANLLPVEYVGYLGVIPVSLVLKGLYDLSRSRSDTKDDAVREHVAPLSIAATQVANGVDTVLVFGPLLADSESNIDLVVVIGFVAMTFAWFGLARFLEHHASRLTILERYGHWVAPIVLIIVGLYILDNTSTDVLPGN
jgi:cadmium resistance protein CadD (predicted permease)